MISLDLNPLSKQGMGLEIPDKSTSDHSFHGFTDATCQSNRAIISRISWILTRLWNRNYNSFPPISRKVTRDPDFIDASIADSVFHLVLLKYHGFYVEHPATLLKRRAYCIHQHFQMKILVCFSAFLRTDAKASVLKAEEEL